MYDVIIIGGGPAGLMAAAGAGREGARVLLLEKGDRLGRKLIISGGGRCNVTNRKPWDELIKHIPGNGRFLYSAFSQFSNEDIIALFEGLGVRLKEEDRGRMFPVTDKAVTVANALISHLRSMGVEFRLQAPVGNLVLDDERCRGVVLSSGEEIEAGSVIVAVGGRSVPRTGSTGDGYAWAREAGHSITRLYPAEVPLTASDRWVQERVLQGLSLRAVSQTLYDPAGKRVTTQEGDMLFTHFGISGPVTLRTSHYVSVTFLKHGRQPLHLTVDLFPGQTAEQLGSQLVGLLAADPKKALRNVLKPFLPERLIPLLLQMAGLDGALTAAHLPRDGWAALQRLCKAFPVTVTGTLSLDEAFVTGGGIAIKEIDPRTMESRLKPGLFFAGEVMDIHAHTGGYNITVAFSSGFVAGKSAALRALAKA